jgi:hypothetical protein
LAIFLWSYFHRSVPEADFRFLHARLALQVLLNTVGSKVSSHPFDAHLDVFYLRLRDGRDADAQ